jgi:hypothetical protein
MAIRVGAPRFSDSQDMYQNQRTPKAPSRRGSRFSDSQDMYQHQQNDPSYQETIQAANGVPELTPGTTEYWAAVDGAWADGRSGAASPSNMYGSPAPAPAPGGGGGGGGGRRAGGGQNAQLANLLKGVFSQGNQGIDAALGNFTSGLGAMPSPYTGVSMPNPMAAQNPLAQFMSANGASQEGVNSLAAMLQNQAQLTQQASQGHQTAMNQAWNGMVAGRQGDAQQSAQNARQQLLMGLLQAAMNGHLNPAKLGLTF